MAKVFTQPYDAWFQAKIQDALESKDSISHSQVMNEAQKLLNKKRATTTSLLVSLAEAEHEKGWLSADDILNSLELTD